MTMMEEDASTVRTYPDSIAGDEESVMRDEETSTTKKKSDSSHPLICGRKRWNVIASAVVGVAALITILLLVFNSVKTPGGCVLPLPNVPTPTPTQAPTPTPTQTPTPTPTQTPTPTPTQTPTPMPTQAPTPTPTQTPMPPDAAELLPIRIPIDRCFDVQWSPPGHPVLDAWLLDVPYGDRQNGDRNGYYAFAKDVDGGMIFVRKSTDGSIVRVFERVQVEVISDQVLLFNGEPAFDIPGGGYETLIKAPSIIAGDGDGSWATQSYEDAEMSMEDWLLKHFSDENATPAPSPGASSGRPSLTPTQAPTRPADPTAGELLPIEIPINRCFDVQWNPPGHPTLTVQWLQPPYNDRYGRRDGHYAFEKLEDGRRMSFVRKRPDGAVLRVFEEVEFLVVSDDVLLFNGDPSGASFVAGGGYGTLVKAPSVPAGDAGGSWATQPLANNSSEIASAEEWLLEKFAKSHHAV